MILFLFGTKVRFRTVGSTTFHCPVCDTDRPGLRREARRWVTVFFIPIMPSTRLGVVVECAHCGTHFDDRVLQRPTLEQSATDLGVARRALVAYMVDVSGNTTVARQAAVSLLRDAGERLYDTDQLDVDRTTSDRGRVMQWIQHLRGTVAPVGAESLLLGAAWVAAADGVLEPGEREVIDELGSELGLTPMHIEGVVSHAYRIAGHRS